MKPFTKISIVFLAINLFMMTLTEAQTKLIPVKDFFRNPEKARYQISPDGNWISFMSPYENRMNVFVQKIDSKEAKRITSETARDIGGYFWKGNSHILYIKDFGGDENFHLFRASIDGKETTDLTPFEKVRVNIVDDLEDFDDEVLIGLNKRNPEVFDVYHLQISTGKLDMVAENPGNISGWVTDHNGKIRVATTSDGVNTSLLYRETEADSFQTVLTTSYKETIAPLFFTFDNRHIYASSNLGRDKQAIVRFDIEKGKELEIVFEHPEVDVDGLNYSHLRKVLTMVTYERAKPDRIFLDDITKMIYARLEKELEGYHFVITSMNKREDKFLVRTYSDRSLGAYYFYDLTADKLTKLNDFSPWLNENDLSEMTPISYTTRDGETVFGYLTLPKGKPAKNIPVVINPHGGPWARDSWGFNPEVQFLANRGYAVLQMNFRGSTGYGRRWWELSFKQWGKTMQDDITDGVNWLIKEGIANPKKIAIYGGSYGGYATLAGITFTPDLYACAVDYVGVSNLFTFMKTIPPYWKPYLQMMQDMVGYPDKDSLMLRAASPVFHVDKIKCPLFIAQGAKDPRVNKNESDQVVAALKKRGIEVEYMVKDNEGHGFHNEENRFAFYEAMEKFLAKYLN
ncbi:MAG: S9 family peptidase [Bacteroidia bacterium]